VIKSGEFKLISPFFNMSNMLLINLAGEKGLILQIRWLQCLGHSKLKGALITKKDTYD
jgi:hypothetical protein